MKRYFLQSFIEGIKTPDRRYAWILVIIYLCLLPVFLYPKIHGNDGIGYFVYLRSIVMDGDLDFTNEFAHYSTEYTIVGYNPQTGHPVTGIPPGCAVLWAPFYLVAHGITLSEVTVYPADGYGYPYELAVALGTSFYGLLGLLIVYWTGLRWYSSRNVFWAVIAGWLASPLMFYMYIHSSMSHANSFFMAALVLWSTLRLLVDKSDRWSDYLILGLSSGMMGVIRNQDMIFWSIPLVVILILRNRKMLLIPVCIGMVFCIQLGTWWSLNGSPFSGPVTHYVGHNFTPWAPNAFNVLFSGRHGLFTWNPVFLFGLLGWLLLRRKSGLMVFLAVMMFLLQLWVVGSWREWWGAYSFGHRMFVSLLPFFMVGLAALWDKSGQLVKLSSIIPVFILILILWNFGLMAQYIFSLLNRDGLTPFSKVIYQQFTVLPQYLFQLIQ